MTAEGSRIVGLDADRDSVSSLEDGFANADDLIVLAQADGDPVPLPGDPGDPGTGNVAIPAEITPDDDNVVRLPSGVTIEELRLDGADIILVQADGTEIRIINAALNIPTFVIDGIEVPQEVLVAVLGENGINVAAGPEGQLTVVGPGPQGSGANFNDGVGDGDGDGGPGVLGLLQGTELGGGGEGGEEVTDGSGIAPTISAGGDTGILVESDDVPNGVDAEPVPATGTLSFFDPDFGETRTAEITARTLVSSNIVHGPTLTTAQIDALLAGFTLDDAASGGVTSEPSAAGNGTVDWTYTVANALIDFLAAGETVVLDFVVTISDGINDVPTTVRITVQGTNDIPVFEAADVTVVDEEILSDGNDGDSYPGGDDVDPNGAPPFGGSLNITWGPDDYSDNAQTIVNGEVAFTNVVTWSTGAPLTSRGEDITTTLSNDGQTITGTAGGRVVFIATVDEQGDGTYTFELQDVLDHPVENAEDSVSLTFGLNVTDSNSFSQPHEFTVTVNDDAPVADGAAVEVTSDEGDIVTFNSIGSTPFDTDADGSTTGPFIPFIGLPATSQGSVASVVSFGADGPAAGNRYGFTDEAASTLEGYGLQSKGEALSFVVVDTPFTGYTIIGYVDNGSGSYSPFSDRTVMSFTLDRETGDFAFRLFDQLDHIDDGNNDTNTELDTLHGPLAAIDFGAVLQATDNDGDTITLDGKADVLVTDDIPVALAEVIDHVRVDETYGSHSDNTFNPFVAARFNGSGILTAVTDQGTDADLPGPIYARHNVVDYLSTSQSGADDTATYKLSLQMDDADSGLFTTEGDPIILSLDSEGRIVGRVDGGTHDGEAAFAVHIDNFGRVSIAQYISLRHPDPDSSDEHISLDGKVSAVLTVTDNDGDTVTDTVSIGSSLTFDDDGPELDGSSVEMTAAENDILNLRSQGSSPGSQEAGVDSTSELALLGGGFASTVSGTVAGTVDFGADGAASGGGFGFAGNAVSTLNGLGLTSKGGDVVFTQVGDVLIGYVDNAFGGFQPLIDRPVMSLQLNDDGSFTFRLYDQLDHLDDGNNDEGSELANGLDAIDFGAVIEATDGDGDAITLNGNLLITIKDDVPSAELVTDNAVAIDESGGNNNDNTTNGNVIAQFTGVTNPGFDPDIGTTIYARDDVVDFSTAPGADEPITNTTLSLRIDNADSDLQTTDGQDIVLFKEGDLIVGRVGDQNGVAAFALAVDSQGRVSIAQYLSLNHPNSNNPNDRIDLDGKVSAVLSVTDADGDTAETTIAIGDLLRFRDDGPGSPDVNSAMLENDTHVVTLADGVDFDFGSDGAGNVAVNIGAATVTDGPTGATLGLPGIAFTGGDTITITPGTAFDALPDGETAILRIPYTVTDADGDATDGEVLVTITGTNDVPVIAGGVQAGTVTELPDNDPNEGSHLHEQTGTIDFSDADAGDTHQATLTLQSVTWDGPGALSQAQSDALAGQLDLALDQGAGSVTWTYQVQDDAIGFLDEDQTATVVYRVTIDDGNGGTAFQDVTIIINGALDNTAPTVADGGGAGDEDTLVAVTLNGDDADGNLAGFVIKSLPSNGALWLNTDGTGAVNVGDTVTSPVYFQPDADWSGTTSFDYTAIDSEGMESANSATATVDVAPVADTPSLSVSAPGADGAPAMAGQLVVNEQPGSTFQIKPEVTQLADGRVLFTWQAWESDTRQYGVSARIGEVQAHGGIAWGGAGEFVVNEEIAGVQAFAQVTQLADGRLLFTWHSQDPDVDGDSYGIAARVGEVQADGSIAWDSAGEITINQEVEGTQQAPQVTLLADGRVLFAWASSDPDVDGDPYGIAARVGEVQADGGIAWDSAGEITINQETEGHQLHPQVTQLADGRLLFTWESYDPNVGGISARIGAVQADGDIAWAGEFRVNEETQDRQVDPEVTQLADGRILFTWERGLPAFPVASRKSGHALARCKPTAALPGVAPASSRSPRRCKAAKLIRRSCSSPMAGCCLSGRVPTRTLTGAGRAFRRVSARCVPMVASPGTTPASSLSTRTFRIISRLHSSRSLPTAGCCSLGEM